MVRLCAHSIALSLSVVILCTHVVKTEDHPQPRIRKCGSKSCIRGYCNLEDLKCVCDIGFIGERCNKEDDSAVKWCNSVKSYKIDNSILESLPDKFLVECHRYRSKNVRNKADALTLGSIIENGVSKEAPSDIKFGKLYQYNLWMQLPSFAEICCKPPPKHNNVAKLLSEVIKFNANFKSYHSLLADANFRKEVTRVCFPYSEVPFCTWIDVYPLLDLISTLPDDISSWNSDDKLTQDLVYMLAIALGTKYRGIRSMVDHVDAKKRESIILYNVNHILEYIHSDNRAQLRKLAAKLPPTHLYTQSTASCKTDSLCLFMKIVGQVENYVSQLNINEHPVLLNGRKRVLLNTGIDYTEFLKQKQMDRALQLLAEQKTTSAALADQLKQYVSSQFADFMSFYDHVESFNQDIAKADIGYITGRLEMFNEKVKNIVGKFQSKLTVLIIQMMIGAGLELAEATVTLALAIADACNPLGYLFGGADPVDLQQAIAGFANALAQLAKGTAITVAWVNTKDEAIRINNNLKKNKLFLLNLRKLIYDEKIMSRGDFDDAKNRFLEMSNDYDPQVVPDDLVRMNSLWSGLAGAACEIVDQFSTAAGSAARAVIYGQNLCVDLPILADRMGELYQNIYDFQFDLIDAMTEYMVSRVTMEAAQQISDEFMTLAEDKKDSQLEVTQQLTSALTIITYKSHTLLAINHYCNLLEYKDGGVKPKECNGESTDLALLIANTVSECASESEAFYEVPIQKSHPNDTAFVDISNLFATGTVNFKIPSVQWLIDHQWIDKSEKDLVFFVKRFNVYLPIETNKPTKFHVTADPILHNQLKPTDNATDYLIIPHTPLFSEYVLGPKRTACNTEQIPNPYTSCKIEETNVVCPLTTTNSRIAYPSLFSEWAITLIHGGETFAPPNPATNMSVIFGLKLCKLIPEDFSQFQFGVSTGQEVNECCPDGQYRLNATADCALCPNNSQSTLAGYYCEQKQ